MNLLINPYTMEDWGGGPQRTHTKVEFKTLKVPLCRLLCLHTLIHTTIVAITRLWFVSMEGDEREAVD